MKGRSDRKFRHPDEGRALAFLEGRGHILLRHNYHTGYAEIDLLTLEPARAVLHVVEVKAWAGDMVHPTESFLTKKKRDGLRRAVLSFMSELENDAGVTRLIAEHGLHADELDISFDLAWLRGDSVEWFSELF